MPVGIKTIELVTENESLTIVKKTIFGKAHRLLEIREGQSPALGAVLYQGTKNKQSTISKTKWILGARDENEDWQWTGWEQNGVAVDETMDVGNQEIKYASAVTVKVNDTHLGKLYWLEAFIIYPELPEANIPKGIFLVSIDKPKILSAAFAKENILQKTIDNVGERQILDYGEILHIKIHTHLLARRDSIHIKCQLGEKELTFTKILHPVFENNWDYNGIAKLSLHIDPAWRDEAGHTSGEKKLLIQVEGEKWEVRKNTTLGQPMKVAVDNTRVRRRPMQFANRNTELPIEEDDPLKDSYEFLVRYSENNDIITNHNKGVEQLVSIYDTKVTVQNDHPCRYVSILVKEIDKQGNSNRRFIAFSENGNGTVNDQTDTVFAIVAGKSNNKKTIQITVGGVKTEACVAYQQEHHTLGIFELFKQKAKQQSLETDEYQIEETQIQLYLTYPYLVRDDLGWLLKYIWMPNVEPISYFVPIQSCAYPTQGVRIDVYPDIKWQVKFSYGTKNPAFYRDSWVKMTQWRVDDAVNKAQAADIDGYDGSLYMNFDLALSAKWDGSEGAVEITFKYVRKIQHFLGIFLKAKRIIDTISYADKGREAMSGTGGIASKFLERLKRKPITLEIYYPKFEISAEWEYKVNESEHNAYLAADGKIGFSPLIGGKGSLDLIALSQNIPVAGQVIKALDLAASIVNVDPIFELAAIGEVNLEIEIKSNTKSGNKDFAVSLNGKLGLRIELSVKAKGKVDAIIFTADVDVEAGAIAESYVEPKISSGNDEKGIYINASMDFTGVKLTLHMKAEANAGIFSGRRQKKLNFQLIDRKPNFIHRKAYII